MKQGICYIVSAGDVSRSLLPAAGDGDLVIAADAGYRALFDAGIKPDLFVGDGDSLGAIPDVPERVVLRCEKDDTDTEAAIKAGLGRGYLRFVLLGALGGKRFSHSLANLQCLSLISSLGGDGVIADERCTVRLVKSGSSFSFEDFDGYFSLFPVCGEASVTITGAKYSGENVSLPRSSTVGVSNETRGTCTVGALSGDVLLVSEPRGGIGSMLYFC